MTHGKEYWQVPLALRPILSIALGIGLGFVSLSNPPNSPLIRTFLIAIPTLIAFKFAPDFSPDQYLNRLFSRFLLMWLAHMSFVLCLAATQELGERKRLGRPGRDKQGDSQKRLLSWRNRTTPNTGLPDWRYALKMLFNGRMIGTPLELPLVTLTRGIQAAKYHRTNTSQGEGEAKYKGKSLDGRQAQPQSPSQQSKAAFIRRRAFIMLCRYVILCVYFDPAVRWNIPGNMPLSHLDFTADRTPFFRRFFCFSGFISPDICTVATISRDSAIRLQNLLNLIVPDYFTLSSFHDALAIIGVGLALDQPDEWPQLFGSITQAFTVRAYWSKFWHLLIYRSFTAHACLFSTRVLKIENGSTLARYMNNALVFLLSGLMHMIVEWKMLPSYCGYWQVMVWFSMQVVAIAAEEVVQKIWAVIERRFPLEGRKLLILQRVKRVVGHLWTMGWLVWSTSIVYFPKTACLLQGG